MKKIIVFMFLMIFAVSLQPVRKFLIDITVIYENKNHHPQSCVDR